jgi:hypothetical protein
MRVQSPARSGRSEPNLFHYVALEARETPAMGKLFFLDFLLYRTFLLRCDSISGAEVDRVKQELNLASRSRNVRTGPVGACHTMRGVKLQLATAPVNP